jgi:hypothetical protein
MHDLSCKHARLRNQPAMVECRVRMQGLVLHPAGGPLQELGGCRSHPMHIGEVQSQMCCCVCFKQLCKKLIRRVRVVAACYVTLCCTRAIQSYQGCVEALSLPVLAQQLLQWVLRC